MDETPTILIRCVRRPDTNVYFTLANMAAAEPAAFATLDRILLVSGDNDTEFLAPLNAMNRIQVRAKDVSGIASWKPKRKGAWSYSFAMHEAAAIGRDCIVMEDDVTFSNGWFGRLMASVRELRKTTNRFILSAYHRSRLESQVGYAPCPPKTQFWGNLCTYWCRELIPGFLPHFDKCITQFEDLSTDLTVQDYVVAVGGTVYFTVPSLVQHCGDKTTLRPDGIRRSAMFEPFTSK